MNEQQVNQLVNKKVMEILAEKNAEIEKMEKERSKLRSTLQDIKNQLRDMNITCKMYENLIKKYRTKNGEQSIGPSLKDKSVECRLSKIPECQCSTLGVENGTKRAIKDDDDQGLAQNSGLTYGFFGQTSSNGNSGDNYATKKIKTDPESPTQKDHSCAISDSSANIDYSMVIKKVKREEEEIDEEEIEEEEMPDDDEENVMEEEEDEVDDDDNNSYDENSTSEVNNIDNLRVKFQHHHQDIELIDLSSDDES